MLPFSSSENEKEQADSGRLLASQGLVCLSLVDDLVFFPICSSALQLFLLLLFLTFSALVANPKKTTLHGGQSRSWSAEQGKKEKEKVWQRTHPPPPRAARSEKIKNNKIKN